MGATDQNDGFSKGRVKPGTIANPSDIPEVAAQLQDQSWLIRTRNGAVTRFIKPLIPRNRFINGFLNPGLSTEFITAAQSAKLAAKFAQLARKHEGDIKINSRLLPGIFKGLRIGGGVQTERFDQKRHRLRKKGIFKSTDPNKEPILFQIDKGIRPHRGRANYILLDDEFSDAWAKSDEFIRIVTDWEAGQEPEIRGIPRVFSMETFISGGPINPFVFRHIKILDYDLELVTDSMEGEIRASFIFEQFEVLETERLKAENGKKVKTEISGADATPPSTDTDEVNPLTTIPIETGVPV